MTITDLDIDDIKQGLADGSILLVDVREPHEFAAGHIPGSVSHPLSRFDPAELPDEPGKRVVFSCAAGVRSRHALAAAQAAGLPIDSHYAGGFKDWMMRGEAVSLD
jgi:rhodanese-related sulfurtransferase